MENFVEDLRLDSVLRVWITTLGLPLPSFQGLLFFLLKKINLLFLFETCSGLGTEIGRCPSACLLAKCL